MFRLHKLPHSVVFFSSISCLANICLGCFGACNNDSEHQDMKYQWVAQHPFPSLAPAFKVFAKSGTVSVGEMGQPTAFTRCCWREVGWGEESVRNIHSLCEEAESETVQCCGFIWQEQMIIETRSFLRKAYGFQWI